MTFLGDDWIPGPDGMRYRHAARVLVFDPCKRLLLAQGHDLDDPQRHWWFTIGGGRKPGEPARVAAVRELYEETGIKVEASQLIGPVIKRTAILNFTAETVKQYEQFFLIFLTHPAELKTTGWTSQEQSMMDDLRWWTLPALADQNDQVYPENLVDIATGLQHGWDGTVLELGEVHDPA